MNRSVETSEFLAGKVGRTVDAREFPAENYLIQDGRYDYEGNWAFCTFDDPEILGARFGFGRGAFDAGDFGGKLLPSEFLMLHLEVMFKDGAALWVKSGHYQADDVMLAENRLECRLEPVFEISGWPDMVWKFQSDDGELKVEAHVHLRNVTILPDNVSRHNHIAMWVATGTIQASIRYGDTGYEVDGVIFYDHPRLMVRETAVPAFGRNLYVPAALLDGSLLISHYTEDAGGERVDDYSFGVLVEPGGEGFWLGEAVVDGLELDADGKPAFWKQRLRGSERTVELEHAVSPTGVLKSWGSPGAPQSRAENGNIPLVFKCQGEVSGPDGSKSVQGRGLAEYLQRAAWF